MKIWKPFPKQEEALLHPASEVFEILFGGARGPGKTDAGMVWLLGEELPKDEIGDEDRLYIHHPRYRCLVLRKNADDLNDWLDRASHMYKRYGARVLGQPARIEFPGGAIFRTGHLKDRKSYEKYLGHEYQRILIEELTQIPREIYYLQIMGSCRSTIPEIRPQMFNTTNPGGVGHIWVKERFIDIGEWGKPHYFHYDVQGKRYKLGRVFIHATLDDNPIIQDIDPQYIVILEALKDKDPDLYEAWRHGNWNIFAGQFFKTYKREYHIVDHFEPKKELIKYSGCDWGMSSPFCFLAGAFEKVEYIDSTNLEEHKFNRVWVYRELYDNEKQPHEWAEIIKKSVNLDEFKDNRADPKMFHRLDDGSRSIASQFKEKDVTLLAANNDRVAGWVVVKNWLSIAPDGLPYMMFSDSCVNLIRTLPGMVKDENNSEDLDTDTEDHAVDALRYMLMHIKWVDASLGGVKRQIRGKTIPTHTNMININKFHK